MNRPYRLWPGADGDPLRCRATCWAQPSSPSISRPDQGGPARRLVFTGDLGRPDLPILRDPTTLAAADILLIESTYASRTHPPIEESSEALKEMIRRTSQRGGKVIIPSFAVERTQMLVFLLNKLYDQGDLPDIPVFVDSPLAVDVTEIFRKHPEYFDQETQDYLRAIPRAISSVSSGCGISARWKESKKLHDLRGPCVIISASGMCEAGRIQHHLKNNIEDHRNTILIVGWQAPYTLGRRLVEKTPVVKIFGREYRLEAEVVTLNGFSGHADLPGLLSWWQAFKPPRSRPLSSTANRKRPRCSPTGCARIWVSRT